MLSTTTQEGQIDATDKPETVPQIIVPQKTSAHCLNVPSEWWVTGLRFLLLILLRAFLLMAAWNEFVLPILVRTSPFWNMAAQESVLTLFWATTLGILLTVSNADAVCLRPIQKLYAF